MTVGSTSCAMPTPAIPRPGTATTRHGRCPTRARSRPTGSGVPGRRRVQAGRDHRPRPSSAPRRPPRSSPSAPGRARSRSTTGWPARSSSRRSRRLLRDAGDPDAAGPGRPRPDFSDALAELYGAPRGSRCARARWRGSTSSARCGPAAARCAGWCRRTCSSRPADEGFGGSRAGPRRRPSPGTAARSGRSPGGSGPPRRTDRDRAPRRR